MTPIIMKTEEAVEQYSIRKRKGNQTQLIDREVELKNWPHPADVVKIIEDNGYKGTNNPDIHRREQERTWSQIWSGNICWKGT